MTVARGSRLSLPLRWLLTLGLLVTLLWWLDTAKLISELSRFSAGAVLLALMVSIAQVLLSAWRWRYTAHGLGLGLSMRVAVQEYYLAMFLNQCLPGGVVGDLNRAWRHGGGSGARQTTLHAVMIERLSGQMVMVFVALCAVVWLAAEYPAVRALFTGWGQGVIVPALAVILGAFFILVIGGRLWQRLRDYLATLGNDIYRGLLNSRALPLQALSSLMVVGTYLAVFAILAFNATGDAWGGEALTMLALCSLLLLAMVIPLTVAGWGVREGTAALLWPLAGFPAEQGVALSVAYGLTVLLSSLPGALFVFSRPSADH